ncbi:ADL241Wp [Eremothecium gossypii ATCC 10895]|uniref:Conserved oligomeric Golgi complex subunit 5 n=1 Tax=Eremothecium gossypii (strain ATCC 10895 / CBS 109.51 / FGSC 9923 / NRRL Y-1056) TaxID=284811 RepID=Q75B18_EREGS|nr:ADL241Wp [Eremothecium gossypii ATCC 10895]AAS51679.1 ADL241Wp [Eremothecium gossypii ATCC 10895]
MSDSAELQDFEVLLEDNFNHSQFARELIRAINNKFDTTKLDLYTPLKQVNYDIVEVDKRIDRIIKDEPLKLLEQLDKRKLGREKVGTTLKPSLDYLTASFERLQTAVLEPYEDALKLQSALGKIHQTSHLLRDALIYMHMAAQVESLPLQVKDPSRVSHLSTLFSQLRINLEQNPNLRSLQLIKKLEEGPLREKRGALLKYVLETLLGYCEDNHKLKHNLPEVQKLLVTLYSLSPREFSAVLDKVALKKIQASHQALTKTITAVRTLNTVMEDVVSNGVALHHLEKTLEEIPLETTTLHAEYISRKKYSSITANYWIQVANAYKREFEISYRRGGPVGKSLSNNAVFIRNTITESMKKGWNIDGLKEYQEALLASISILDNRRKT